MAFAESETDIAVLWGQALDDYTKVSKVDIRKIVSRQGSIEAIVTEQRQQLESFKGFRHDKSDFDKLRHTIATNSAHIQQVAGLVANAAASAFPPSAVILTAFNCVLNASTNVSADYDMIQSFFDLMQSFLQRLSLLEGRIPEQRAFQQHVVKVFSSLLKLCALAHSYCVQGRFVKWAKALVDGKDPELKGAFDSLNDNIQQLESAIVIQTLRTAIESNEESKVIKQTVTSIQAQATMIQVSVDKNMATTLQTYDVAQQTLTVTMDVDSGVKEVVMRSRDSAKESEEILRRLKKMEQRDDEQGKIQGLKTGAGKPTNLARLRNILNNPAEAGMIERLHELEVAYVDRVFDWVESDPIFVNLLDDKERFLWVSGGPGMGKSALAFKMVRLLKEKLACEPSTRVACFFFDEEQAEMRSLENMLRWCALQVAQGDRRYCEEMLKEMLEDLRRHGDNSMDAASYWASLVESKFSQRSNRRLVLVLDGIDEGEPGCISQLAGFFDRIKSQEHRIQVIMTSGPEVTPGISSLGAKRIELTKAKIAHDLYRFSRFQARTLSRLRKLRRNLRGIITSKVSEKADSFLYVQHAMRRLNGLVYEGPILKELEDLPLNITALYETLLKDCQKNRSEEDLEVLRRVLIWLAYSRSELTIGETSKLVDIIQKGNSVSIEEELEGRLSRLLRLSGGGEATDGADDASGSEPDQPNEMDPDDLVRSREEARSLILSFQERSLKAYVRQPVDKSTGLRCTAVEAHATIFCTMSTILTTSKKKDRSREESSLALYAATWCFSHLLQIQLEDATDDLASEVLESLFNIVNKDNALWELEQAAAGFSMAFGKLSGSSGTGSVFSVGDTTPGEVLDALQRWATRALHLTPNNLPDGVLEWFRPLSQEPSRAYIAIARGHINNWFSAGGMGEAFVAFRCAHDALEQGKHLSELQQNQTLRQYFGEFEQNGKKITPHCFELISNVFGDIAKTSKSFIGIGQAMRFYYMDEAAVKEFDLGLQDGTTDSVERFYLLYGKGYALLEVTKAAEDDEKAKIKYAVDTLDTFDKAIDIYRNMTDINKADSDICRCTMQIFQNHAVAATLLGKFDLVLGSITAAASMAASLQMDLHLDSLDAVIMTLAQSSEPLKAIEVLKVIPKRDLIYYFATVDTDFLKIQEAAKRTGQGQYLLNLYADIARALGADPRGVQLRAMTKVQAASFALRALSDATLAETLLRDIVQDAQAPMSLVSWACQCLTEIFLESFRHSHDPLVKQAALAETKKLQARLAELEGDTFRNAESNVSVAVALMLRRLGPAHEFADVLQAAFRSCVDALRDDVGGNDYDAFRRMARVLGCLDGFEKEASVALTAQLYIVDDEVHEKDLARVRQAGGEDRDGDISSRADGPGPAVENGPPPIVNGLTNGDGNDGSGTSMPETAQLTTPEVDQGADEGLAGGAFYCNVCLKVMKDWSHGGAYLCVNCLTAASVRSASRRRKRARGAKWIRTGELSVLRGIDMSRRR